MQFQYQVTFAYDWSDHNSTGNSITLAKYTTPLPNWSAIIALLPLPLLQRRRGERERKRGREREREKRERERARKREQRLT